MRIMIKVAWPMFAASALCLFILTCSRHNDSVEIAVVDVRGDLPAVLGGATAPGLEAELKVAGGAAYPVTLNPDGSLNCFIPGVFAGTHTLTMSFFIMSGSAAAAGSGQTKLALGEALMTVYLGPGLNHIIFDLSSLTFPDDDGDGISNLDEFLLGTDPLTKNIVEQYLPYVNVNNEYGWGVEINSLFFTSADDGWAVGQNFEGSAVITHYVSGAWIVVNDPAPGIERCLNSVHFPAVGEGWAVGSYLPIPGSFHHGLILHYSGGQWSEVAEPEAGSDLTLKSVYFPSVDEGWAVGVDTQHISSWSYDHAVMWHYSSGAWSVVDLSGLGLETSDLRSVHFTSAGEGWAVGVGESSAERYVDFGLILHYSGGAWSLVSAPLDIYDDMELNSVQFTSADEGWAVGLDWFYGSAILHYSQGVWTAEDVPALGLDDGMLNSVFFPTDDEGWAVGNGWDGWSPFSPGTVLHYHDGSWSRVTPPFIQTYLPPDDGNWPPIYLNAVHFPTADKGWVGGAFVTYDRYGQERYNDLIIKFDAAAWTASSPLIMDGHFLLRELSFPDLSDGWAVGYSPSNQNGFILHYQDGAWKNIEPPWVDADYWFFNGVEFPDPSLGWAVGASYLGSDRMKGLVLRYDSGLWSEDQVPDVGSSYWQLASADFPSTGQGWAVGYAQNAYVMAGGVILKYESGSWSNVPPPDTGSSTWALAGVSFPSSDQGWAVGYHSNSSGDGQEPGDRGIMLHYDSGTWSNVDLPEVAPGWALYKVDFPSVDEGWAVGIGCQDSYSGCAGVILHYTGGSWQIEPAPAVPGGDWYLTNLSFPTPDEGWAVGAWEFNTPSQQGLILHYSGGKWQAVSDIIMDPRPYKWRVDSVSCPDQDNCWFAGNDYKIMQGDGLGLILKY
ncbi:MAG TPA: hypothetical protein VM658_22085 [bacterium]|nr:hypothetical protein [bacterium]